ncbi:MAG: hypothetical protein M3271_04575, partial [Actinomycetota bacterium]|nr:hypothetical protein [Actinomycetota bacterium]
MDVNENVAGLGSGAAPAAPPEEQSGSPVPPGKRAVVYIPQLGHREGESVADLATRIAAVLDVSDEDQSVQYVVQDQARTVRFGRSRPKKSASAATVVRKTGSESTSLGIYEFSYSTSLVEKFERQTPLLKALTLLTTVGLNLGRLLRSLVAGRTTEHRGLLRTGVVSNLVLVALTIVYFFPGPRTDWHWLPWTIVVVAGVCTAIALAAVRRRGDLETRQKKRVQSILAVLG